ncbi:hypothetical protein [Myxosarcina sp. GI1]|uniref:hypothetical protein n=1 Tax=Myxosarcina sp. GI1 TaxID=1541065 RepID=UPI00056A639D|nr:hypothetical protein [Myxosarcina sp. GI1]
MLNFWLICVGVLFVLAEFGLWIKDFILPLPIYILAGAFLALASNYESGIINLFRQQDVSTLDPISQTATLIDKSESIESNNVGTSTLPPTSEEHKTKLLNNKQI